MHSHAVDRACTLQDAALTSLRGGWSLGPPRSVRVAFVQFTLHVRCVPDVTCDLCDWEAVTSQIMPPKPNYAKQMANGIEQNVEMYGPIKRVFLSDKILDRWKEEIGAYLAFISCRTTCLIYFWIGGPKAGSLPAVLTTIDVQTYALLQPPASHPSVAISPQISSQQASFSIPPPSVNSTSQALPVRKN